MKLRRMAVMLGQVCKRFLDVALTLCLLLILAPVLLGLILALRLQGGAALFAHVRIGRHGAPFRCYKFRTMLPDAERRLQELLARDAQARQEWEKDFKLRNDPRVTPFGEFLRKSSLDELPQLWNVLVGDMSLVGPRPVVEAELLRYGNRASLYTSVRPGITGLWQVSGRNDTTYEERVRLDAQYVQNWSLSLDWHILWRTLFVVLGRRGAY
ncbi:sugar transferase [Chitinimonas sp.]|uniref:sugar transferase n=1 Tax=Chitinimonas sp. TaxID=1934313 RepID=UPI002F945C89